MYGISLVLVLLSFCECFAGGGVYLMVAWYRFGGGFKIGLDLFWRWFCGDLMIVG